MNTLKHIDFYLKEYVSLSVAKQLNNSVKSESAYVYDRFSTHEPEVEITVANIAQEFDKYVSSLRPVHSAPIDSLFKLVPVDTFDTQEQILDLIGKGHFYYAPEVS